MSEPEQTALLKTLCNFLRSVHVHMQETGKGSIQSTAAPQPPVAAVAVRTPEELTAAFAAGTRHIRLVDHIDLRGWPTVAWETYGSFLVGPVSTETHTVIVRHCHHLWLLRFITVHTC